MSNFKKKYEKGYRGDLLRLSLACGGVPFRCLDLISPSVSSIQHALRIFINEDMFEKFHEKEICIINITTKTYKELRNPTSDIAKAVSKELIEYYDENTRRDIQKLRYVSGKAYKDAAIFRDAIRIMRNNEVIVFMFGCGTRCLPDERKKKLNNDSKEPVVLDCYYNSKELKQTEWTWAEVKVEDDQIQNVNAARLNGLCVLASGSYIAINLNHVRNFRISKIGELFAIEHIKQTIVEDSLPRFAGSIIFYKDNETIQRLVRPTTPKDYRSSHNLFEVYKEKNIYALPLTKEGQMTYEFMKKEDWKERIYSFTLTESQTQDVKDYDVYDGQEIGAYFFVFCIPDIARLQKFLLKAENDINNNYYIYCFEHQKDLLKEIAVGNVYLRSVPVKKALESYGI